MLDLVDELLEVLEPFDVTVSSWLNLKRTLGEASWNRICRQALSNYLQDRVTWFRITHGQDGCKVALRDLVGVHDTLIRAGRLTADPLVDHLLVYAAHLAALSSYGPAVWDRASKTLLQIQMTVKEKELKR